MFEGIARENWMSWSCSPSAGSLTKLELWSPVQAHHCSPAQKMSLLSVVPLSRQQDVNIQQFSKPTRHDLSGSITDTHRLKGISTTTKAILLILLGEPNVMRP